MNVLLVTILFLSDIPVNLGFFFPFENRINLLFKAIRDTIYSILNDSFKKTKKGFLKKYSKGFYVYAEPKKFKDLKSGIEYVTRYCGRVPISDSAFQKHLIMQI